MVAGLIWTAYNAGYYGFLSYLPLLLAERQHPASLTALAMPLFALHAALARRTS